MKKGPSSLIPHMPKKSKNPENSANEKEEFVTIREASEMLGIYPLTVTNWFDRGIIKGKKTILGTRKPLRKSVKKIRKRLKEGWRLKDFLEDKEQG
jgi:hypothetical protein